MFNQTSAPARLSGTFGLPDSRDKFEGPDCSPQEPQMNEEDYGLVFLAPEGEPSIIKKSSSHHNIKENKPDFSKAALYPNVFTK